MISALHPALCTDEIIRLIIGLLDRKSCARLARTCKAVQEAALDAIWRDIPSVEPLFSLFPPTCMLGNPYEAVVRRVRSSCSLSRPEMTPHRRSFHGILSHRTGHASGITRPGL
jgi:hypothetical protein